MSGRQPKQHGRPLLSVVLGAAFVLSCMLMAWLYQ